MEERMIEISVQEYSDLLQVRARATAAAIYIKSDDFVKKDIVLSIIMGEVISCTSGE